MISKNSREIKRVTSLANALKLNFDIITTNRRRAYMNESFILKNNDFLEEISNDVFDIAHGNLAKSEAKSQINSINNSNVMKSYLNARDPKSHVNDIVMSSNLSTSRQLNNVIESRSLAQSSRVDLASSLKSMPRIFDSQDTTNIESSSGLSLFNDVAKEYINERAREIIIDRLIQEYIVDNNFSSSLLSTMLSSIAILSNNNIKSFES